MIEGRMAPPMTASSQIALAAPEFCTCTTSSK
jgi:hypothetical protein